MNTEIETIKKQLSKKTDELSIMRAKMYLDMVQVNLKIVPEYPDLMEETNQIKKELAQKDSILRSFNDVKLSLEE